MDRTRAAASESRPRESFAVSLGLAAAGGLAIAVSFLRFSLWPLAWIALVPVLRALARSRSYRSAAAVGLVAGVATNVPAFYWLVYTINVFGGFPLSLAVAFYAALSVYSALQFVAFGLAIFRTGFGPLALGPAVVWVALEFVYPSLFPWRLANSQLELPWLLQIGEWTGPFGLSFVMAWTASAVAQAATAGAGRVRPSLAAAGAAMIAVVVFGIVRLPQIERSMAAAPSVRVAVVQGNLTIEEKGDARYFESNLATYGKLTRSVAARADVVIWPETVITEPLPRTLQAIPRSAVGTLGIRGPLLTGALTYAGPPEAPLYFNSVVLIDGEGRVLGMSDKQILMPFGEYMPLGSLFPLLKELSPMTGDFQAGERVNVLDVPGAGRFAPLNCYEDLRASIARDAASAGRAEVLFAVANDAWFGDTAAPLQHEALALWRAVENRRFLVRVTNTGVTDVIDAAGRVLQRLPAFEPAVAVAEVKRMNTGTVHQRFGPIFAWAVLAAAIVLVCAGRRSS